MEKKIKEKNAEIDKVKIADAFNNSKKVNDFLKYCNTESTRRNYRIRLREFFEWKQQDPETYLQDTKKMTRKKENEFHETIETDVRDFLHYIKNERENPLLNTSLPLSAIKELLIFNKIELDETFWKRLRKTANGHKIGKTSTPTTEQLRQILKDADIEAKAFFLIQMTSMSRINEIITLKKQDLELEHEYPRLYIRNIHSKNKQPLRKRISPEAKRELINYLKQRDRIIQTREKRTPTNRKKHYDPDLLFPTSKQNIEEVWKNLLKKANLYRIDPQTGRPELGTHSLRRYGSQHLGNEDFANFFRGEMTESNRAYFDYPDERLDEEYKKHVKNLFVLQTPEETEYKMELYGQELAEANKKLKEFEGLVSILNKTKIDQIKRIEKLERINLEKERDNIYPERTILKPNENLTNKDRQYEDEIEKQVIQEKRQELKDLIKTDPKNKDSEIVTRNGVPYLQKKNTEIKTINHDLQSLRNELIKERAEYKQLNKEMKTLLKQTKQQLKKKLKKEF